MANKPSGKKPSPTKAGVGAKKKAAKKPSGAAKKPEIKKPDFTNETSDLNL